MPRVLAYLSDRALGCGAALEVRRALSTFHVSFRTADLWKGEIERADFIFSPSHPGIERAYVAAGIPVVPIGGPQKPAPNQIRWPAIDVLTIVSGGPHAAQALSKWDPKGFVLVLNRGVLHCKADAWLALDGFEPFDRMENPPTQATILRHVNTVYAENYITIDDVWPYGVGGYTSTAAVTIARVLGVRKVYLVGHDCELDAESEARGWTIPRLTALDNEVRKAAKGLDITRITREGRKDRSWP